MVPLNVPPEAPAVMAWESKVPPLQSIVGGDEVGALTVEFTSVLRPEMSLVANT